MQDQLKYIYEKFQLKNIKEVEAKFLELSTIYNMSNRFKAALSLEEVANLLLLVPMGRLLISKSSLILFDNSHVVIAAQKGIWRNLTNLQQIQFVNNQIIKDDDFSKKNISIEMKQFLNENQVQLIIPLMHQDKAIGMAMLGYKLNKSPLSEEEISFLQTIFDIGTPVLYNEIMINQLKDNNQQLDNHIQLLNTILDTVKGYTFNLDEEKIKKIFYYTLMGQLSINKFIMSINNNNQWQILSSKGMNDIPEKLLADFPQKFSQKNQFIYLNENFEITEDDHKYIGISYHTNKRLTAHLILGPKLNKEQLKEYEIEFAQILLSQTITSLQNIQLVKEKIEKERIEKELQVAKKIQQNLLPSTIPYIKGLDIFAYNEPSKEVGGDYYDVIQIGDYLYFTVADVSGKSVPASILMSNLQSALHTLLDFDISLINIVKKLNHLIYQNTSADKYITFFIGKLNLKNFHLEYVNAGHNPPILYNKSSKEFKLLEKGGIILGMLPDFYFEQDEFILKKDDLLFAFTDGVNETINEDNEEWGDENLNTFIKNHSDYPAKELSHKLLAALDDFKGQIKENYDDITYIILKKIV